MALPFIVLELDEPRKFRFTLGDMVEFQEWTKKKFSTDGNKPLSLEQAFGMLGEDFTVLLRLLWQGLKHETPDLKFEDVGEIVHVGQVPYLIEKVTTFIVAEDGNPRKNPPRPIPQKTTAKKRGTGTKSLKQPVASA